MLDLKDFFHLPPVDALVEQLVADKSGLIIVAGLDPPAAPATADGFLPSGRAAIFRILMRQITITRPPSTGATPTTPVRGKRAAWAAPVVIIAASREAIRIPRQFSHQVEWALVQPPYTYARRIAHAARRQPALIVIDTLNAETVEAALQAAQGGLVLTQLDTIFTGADVARHLLDLGAPRELMGNLGWIITVHRLATLCPHCKQPAPPSPARLAELGRRYPAVSLNGPFFHAAGCARCHNTGREGDVAAFDIWRASGDPAALDDQPSQLPLEEYLLRLATLGCIALDDVFGFHADRLRRTYNLLTASQRALAEANATLQRKLAQLEAANLVLQQRTEALISLQEIGHTLVTLADLDELAGRVGRHARDLCGADRAILYVLRPDGTAEILAASGWGADLLHRRLDALHVIGACGLADDAAASGAEPAPFAGLPPGVPADPSLKDNAFKAGLRVPLIAQHEVVGLMIIHTTQKPSFAPGEVAMLRAFANQAALALQRAGLIDVLRDNIAQLEAAQAELVKKERLERELELARQVQQKLLPHIFPLTPGYAFAARCEPARRVGGDFYDVISLDADRFGVVIADVSDKGLPAALFMALTRSLLLAEARRERSPRAVLTNVHRLLLELGQPDMFVTVFYGIVDIGARQLTYTRAGHDRPLLLRDGAAQLLGGQGTFLGFLDASELRLGEEHIELRPGDRLVLYTDGLVDAVTAEGQLFGLSRLIALLQSCQGLSPDEVCTAVFAGLTAYQGAAEQYDDMTLLVVEVQG